MAKIDGRATLALRVTFELSEEEAGALDALLGYGADAFLEVFYAKMGKAYLQPYERGFRSLCESRGDLMALIDRARDARKVFTGERISTERPRTADAGTVGRVVNEKDK
jgi:hypothetical protein